MMFSLVWCVVLVYFISCMFAYVWCLLRVEQDPFMGAKDQIEAKYEENVSKSKRQV